MARPSPHPQRSALAEVLSVACKRHDAAPSQPCWVIEWDAGGEGTGLCGRRIKATFPHLQPPAPESVTPTSRRPKMVRP